MDDEDAQTSVVYYRKFIAYVVRHQLLGTSDVLINCCILKTTSSTLT